MPVYTLPPNEAPAGVPSVSRDRNLGMGSERFFPGIHPRQACSYDRFIPQRRHRNMDAANYFLTRVPPRSENSNQLDVFEQISNLDTSWRKKLMERALEECNLIPSGINQRVLSFGRNADTKEQERTSETVEDLENGIWKTKARKKPLIGSTEQVADAPKVSGNRNACVLDWGRMNLIATMIGASMSIFDATSHFALARPDHIHEIKARTHGLKWNYAGTKIAICTARSDVRVLLLEPRKIMWRRKCPCAVVEPNIDCEVICVAWTRTDKEIVIGCTEGRLSAYNADTGTLIKTVFAHAAMILVIKFSPNDRYLVSISLDKKVLVVTWPTLAPYLSVDYHHVPKNVAWHPWMSGLMCVGGGFLDGSLTLWDIHRQKSLGYRKIPFMGMVNSMIWNKLSGELVVHWNYQTVESGYRFVGVAAVVASLDRIVDYVAFEPRIFDVVWNPEHTKLALRGEDSIKVWNFFGNETSNWYDAKENKSASPKRKGNTTAGRNFAAYAIR